MTAYLILKSESALSNLVYPLRSHLKVSQLEKDYILRLLSATLFPIQEEHNYRSFLFLPVYRVPWSSLVRGDEALYRHNIQTNLVMVLY